MVFFLKKAMTQRERKFLIEQNYEIGDHRSPMRAILSNDGSKVILM
jgi:hypothetical protein